MQRSVARDTTWFVFLTIGLVLLTASALHYVLSTHNRSHSLERLDTDIETYAYALEKHVDFYRYLIDRLAKRIYVQELLEFEKTGEAFAWAQDYRKLLPGAIGFALIDAQGKVLGEPGALFIGPACRADLRSLAQGGDISIPAVHREIEGLEHFDLVQPVTDINNDLLGYIFASFSLTVLADFSNELIREGHRISLHDGSGQLIVSANRLREGQDDMLEVSRQVPLGNWTMTVSTDAEATRHSFPILAVAAGALALLIGSAVVILSRRISTGLVREVKSIRSALENIADGRCDAVRIRAGFRETRAIMDAVHEISYRIQRQKEALVRLSETDELTGLMNRRRYASELKKVWALASREVDVHIICIDLDGFKQVNDRFGHAMGDKLLKQFAGCLNGCTRKSDLTARVGGDEFVIVLVHSNPESGEDLFKRLGDSFREAQARMEMDMDMVCSLSGGLIKLDVNVDADVDVAMQRVDAALYRAKQAGKNRLFIDGTVKGGQSPRGYFAIRN